MDAIKRIIDSTEGLAPIRKRFYKVMLSARYDQILAPAYSRIMGNHGSIPEKLKI